jgi:seryl-tRNA synthetase
MLDIKFIREKADIVKESQRKRKAYESDIDKILDLDSKWRKLKGEVDSLRSQRNKVSKEISELKKENKGIDELMAQAKEIPLLMDSKEKEIASLFEQRNSLLKEVPNIVDSSVPVGDVSKNQVIYEYGERKKHSFDSRDHADILESMDLLDTKKASEVAGSRFYYLKGDLVRLNYAIIQFALDFLQKRNFILMQPPYMLRREALEGALTLGAFEEMIYKIEGEDLYLIGTAEHAINAYYMNEIIEPSKMPIRFAGVSPCFRKEAGSHGKDTKGIFRIHQFEKIEQFVFCKPQDSWNEFDLILKNSKDLLESLGIPFRFVILSSEDMGRVPTKTIDFEGWFPTQQDYRELGSCSNCLDYQARRSNTKYPDKNEFSFVHTLNNTAIATERMIVCIIDNYQQEDGSIKIPEVLIPYMGGISTIQSKNKIN